MIAAVYGPPGLSAITTFAPAPTSMRAAASTTAGLVHAAISVFCATTRFGFERDTLPAQRGHIHTDILELKPYQTLYLLCIIAVAAAYRNSIVHYFNRSSRESRSFQKNI